MKLKSFNNKVVLITGAASGFGKILAEELASAGAKLVLGDLNIEGLNSVSESLRDQGTEVIAQHCDVTKEADVEALVASAVESFSRLDIAINNAGISTGMKPLIETEEADFDINFTVNTKGVFFGLKYQIRQMLSQGGGTILNVASMAGIGGTHKLAAYCASKHAVVGITKTAAVEYGRKNIRVNAVCPYFSPTPLVTGKPTSPNMELLASGSPMKRLGSPEEMVAAMLMLIAPENSYMTGQAVAVDGGVSAF